MDPSHRDVSGRASAAGARVSGAGVGVRRARQPVKAPGWGAASAQTGRQQWLGRGWA